MRLQALGWNAVTWAADPDLQIIVWTAEPGSTSHERLLRLASWAADRSHAVNRQFRLIPTSRVGHTGSTLAGRK
ncbi:hypothetical protein ACFWFI_03560 [Streptomyces sp. NPDC060209]|uniref:hypothetical protein n=1 Tax=Streptomyces sp. NPDC060209 TaxID=3347073 RepID=UPI00366180C8